MRSFRKACFVGLCSWSLCCAGQPSPSLSIHYINTGQGGSTLILGPDGTSVLYDFGVRAGRTALVPYLHATLRYTKTIDYAILSHRHKDHYYGYLVLNEANYDVRVANYEPAGEPVNSTLLTRNWYEHAKGTTAGPVRTYIQRALIATTTLSSFITTQSKTQFQFS
jgi:beta-lactamase superfamily II metal-dependent hydrolase